MRQAGAASLWAFALLIASALLSLSPARADTYPSRPVRIVVPFAPGGAVDTLGRLIGQSLQQQMGQPFVIENKPGAAGNIGADTVAKAAPDGYTLLVAANGLATNVSLFPSLPFDPAKGFAPISGIGYSPLLVVVHPNFQAKTLKELVDLAKAKPDDLTYASTGIGSSNHLATELLKMRTGIKVRHVAYRGGSPALIDLLGERVSLMLINPIEVTQYVEGGQLRALAVTNATRVAQFPAVPTTAEAGVPDIEASVWWVMATTAGTPSDIVERLNKGVHTALADPEIKEKLVKLGVIARPTTPVELGEFLARETKYWADVIKAGNIKLDQ